MIDTSVLTTLEFNKIREMLKSRTSSNYGQELVQELTPLDELEDVLLELRKTQEAVDIVYYADSVPLGGIRDIRSSVKRAEIGGILEPHEFMSINSTLYAARRMKNFLAGLAEKAPTLFGLSQNIVVLRKLEETIDSTISEQGTVRDEASVELHRLRRDIKNTQQRIKEKLDNILRSQEYHKFFQEVLVTIRGDRYVIPVKQEYRHSFPGIVHDQSASGATVFIEPMAVVTLNNDLKQTIAAEQNEVERILRNLSGQIAAAANDVAINCDMLAQLDVIFAKAYLARDLKANCPLVNAGGFVDLRQARHPLIAAGAVVPIDITIGKSFTTLVITGPNTGGKTVSLKTLGLFVLMVQAGLFIPAAPGSEISIFTQIFADIGDEQSIEQSLSTFSAHMTSLVKTLRKARKGDLVLIDEIGAGTDPDEGAALAMSILEYLTTNSILTIATTHYSELKTFAYSRPGVENASVEFDVTTLKPTYRLLIGTPGSSNAFAISLRLGLDSKIIDHAKQFLNKEHAEFEQVISDLEQKKKEYESHIMEIAKLRQELTANQEKLAQEQESLVEKKRQVLDAAYEEANKVVRQTRREAEAVISELKAQFSVKEEKERQNAIEAARKRLRQSADEVAYNGDEQPGPHTPVSGQLKTGDLVFVTTLKQNGVVVAVGSEEVTVQVGIMKFNVSLNNCRMVEGKEKREKKTVFSGHKISTESVPMQIDVRGTTVEEAENILEKYLDDAVLAGLNEVMVIHGKGTGALRKGLREFLNGHHHVKNTKIAEYNEGGNGATVVKLR